LPEFDRVAEIYDATRSLPADEMRQVLDAITETLDPAWTILDAGVGTGRFAHPLVASGFETVGIDISARMMSKARLKGVQDLVLGSISELPFRDRTFDATVIVHILHLVKDWRAAVREIGRVTKRKVISAVNQTEGDAISESYREWRERLGYPVIRLEGAERRLGEIIAPGEVLPIFDKPDEAEADDDISSYEKRLWSVTWDVPEEVHARIVAELRRSFGGQLVKMRRTMELVTWEPERLKELPLR
jgi:ubiquinone/menaquinone biosynthesis C-methylase UbiE